MSWPDQAPAAPPTPAQSPYITPSATTPGTTKQGAAIASLVLGIFAVLLLLPFFHPLMALIGLACAIAGIICGHFAAGRQSDRRGLAIAGLTLGYVALALVVVHFVGLLALGAAIRHRLR